jgi:hypothetical protein
MVDLSNEVNCLVDNNPVLTKGESVSIISTINYAREIVLGYLRAQSSASTATAVSSAKATYLSSTNFMVLIDMSQALNKSVDFEIATYEKNWTSMNKTFITVTIPLFVGLIIYLVLTLVFYLLFTLAKFRRNVRYNKGVLRLIRHSIIQNNEDLLQYATSDELKDFLE